MENEIYIEISEPVEKESNLIKYIAYTIKGEDKEGNFYVLRRYSDFLLLRKTMVDRWPGVFIASLPEKQAIGNLKQEFI